MKTSLRILSLLTALMLALLPMSSALAINVYRHGDFSCSRVNGMSTLYTYHGGNVAVMPDYITAGTTTYTVTAIDYELFDGYQNILTAAVFPAHVTSVPGSTFEDFTLLSSVTLPAGLTSIGSKAFKNCISLKSINAGGIATIGYSAFEGCASLESIDLTSLKYLQSKTFAGCSSLQKIIFGNALTRVNASAFSGTPITTLVLPDSVTIVEGSFKGASLTHIELPDSVNDLDPNAFVGLENQLEYLRWPAGETDLGGFRFKGFTALKTVILPEGLIGISQNDVTSSSFMGCTALESMDFPNTLEIIGIKSFMDCTNLSSVSFGSGLKMIRANAFANTALTVVYLPAGVTYVSPTAFPEGCVIICPGGSTTAATLTSTKMAYRTPTVLDLPADLTVIEDGAFIGSDAEMVIIPAGCTSIGSRAFADMPNLRYVQLPAGATVAADAFEGCDVVEVVEY